jgi:hypothetical protein
MMPAEAATASIGSVTAITMMRIIETNTAMWGVRWVG